MQHPDLNDHPKRTRKAVRLKVDQVREARRSLTLKPYQSKYRVALFLRFQEANDSASNALLKTLEESAILRGIDPLLRTRLKVSCRQSPRVAKSCDYGRCPWKLWSRSCNNTGADVDQQSRLIRARFSGGRPGYAFEAAAKPIGPEASATRKLNELQSLLPSTRAGRFAYAEKLAKDKEGMRSVLLLWLSFWRDVLLWQRRRGPRRRQHRPCRRNRNLWRDACSCPKSGGWYRHWKNPWRNLIANVNGRLLAEVLLLDWPMV